LNYKPGLLTAILIVTLCAFGQKPAPAPSWIAVSNNYTNMLLAIQMKHFPEFGSRQGLSQFDAKASQPTLADEDQERRETEAVIEKFKAAAAQQQEQVEQDLQIMVRKIQLNFKGQDFERAHDVPFYDPSRAVFGGVQILLDAQTPAARRPAAVARLRAYAGLEPGYKPIAEILKQRVIEQMAKPGVIYPPRVQIETELGRDSNYLEGIAALFERYKLEGWQEPFKTLKSQLTEYDEWYRTNVLSKARSDFRLPPEEYALALQGFGLDIPPARIAAMAHQAFTEIQGEMKPIAAEIAQQRHLSSSDYRDVMRDLKKQQLVGDAILPFYENRLKQIEKIIV